MNSSLIKTFLILRCDKKRLREWSAEVSTRPEIILNLRFISMFEKPSFCLKYFISKASTQIEPYLYSQMTSAGKISLHPFFIQTDTVSETESPTEEIFWWSPGSNNLFQEYFVAVWTYLANIWAWKLNFSFPIWAVLDHGFVSTMKWKKSKRKITGKLLKLHQLLNQFELTGDVHAFSQTWPHEDAVEQYEQP